MIIHICGPSGSGKTTLGNKLKKKYGNKIVVKDLDDLRDEFIKSYYGVKRWTFINVREYQKYINDYIKKHSKKTIKAYTFFNNKNYEVNILWGLNQIEFEAVLAHELLHVWIDYNNLKINNDKLEGFCNLGSSLVYKSYDLKLADILQKSIEEDNDPTYGRGYVYMNFLLEHHGWNELISILLSSNQN